MRWLFLGLLLFVEAVFYYQSKSDAKYRERRLFLVSIPVYAYESDEVVSLRRGFEKENLRNYMIITLLSLPILFLSGLFLPNLYVYMGYDFGYWSKSCFKKISSSIKRIKDREAVGCYRRQKNAC